MIPMDSTSQPIRGLTFGSAAAAYERYRLGYPAQIVDQVVGHATRPVRSALEIGAGTGKATRLFAAAGLEVTALEPDPVMLAQLESNISGDVQPLLDTFESADLHGHFDLVYAAAALHWTDPATRWPKIAALLSPGGVVASFGGPLHIADEQLSEEVRRVRELYVADDDIPSPDGTPADAELRWPGTEMAASDWFTDVNQVVIKRRATIAAGDFIGHLSTISAYLVLPTDQRSEVLSVISSVLPDHLDLVADITLHLARRSEVE